MSGSETAIQEVLPTGGKVSNLRIALTDDPGDGDSYTFTVRRDPAGASPPVSTGIACTISGSSNTTCNSSSSQTFSAGDALSIMVTDGGNPSGRSMFFRLDYQP